MSINDSDQELKQAQQFIETGRFSEAREMLRALSGKYGKNADYWWLIAQIEIDADDRKRAANKAYRLNPEKYSLKVSKLLTGIQGQQRELRENSLSKRQRESTFRPQRSTSPARPHTQLARQDSRQIRRYIFFFVATLLIILITIPIIFVLRRPPVLVEIPSSVQAPTSVAAISTATVTLEVLSATPSLPTVTPLPSLAFSPITRPPSPSLIPATIASNATQVALVNPDQVFRHFPIQVFLADQDPLWIEAFHTAIEQLQRIIQIEITQDPEIANIVIEVLERSALFNSTTCAGGVDIAGCARVFGARDLGDVNSQIELSGHIWIGEDAFNPQGILLHELMHVLGVKQHSENPVDIMYGYETSITQLSERDIELLRELYPER